MPFVSLIRSVFALMHIQGACNPIFREERKAIEAQTGRPTEAKHVSEARARRSHDVTGRATTPRAATPRANTPRTECLASHLSQASIPGYTGHVRGQNYAAAPSCWSVHFKPSPGSIRRAATPRPESAHCAATRPPAWWHSESAPPTPRQQRRSDFNAYNHVDSGSAASLKTLQNRRTPYGLQRVSDAAFSSQLRGQQGSGLTVHV